MGHGPLDIVIVPVCELPVEFHHELPDGLRFGTVCRDLGAL